MPFQRAHGPQVSAPSTCYKLNGPTGQGLIERFKQQDRVSSVPFSPKMRVKTDEASGGHRTSSFN